MRALLRSRKAVAGLILLGMMLLLALVGPLLAQDPAAFVGRPLDPPSTQHWLGTTGQGQDVLAQTLVGARTTLGLGLVVGVAVVAIGAVVGGMSGLFGRRVDELLSFIVNVSLVLPGLPLMVAGWLATLEWPVLLGGALSVAAMLAFGVNLVFTVRLAPPAETGG